MVIDKLGALNNIMAANQSQIRQASGTDAKTEKKSDRVESSSEGVKRSQLQAALKKAVSESEGVDSRAEDVRWDKVAAAKEKIQNGSLLTDKVIEEIADRIADFFIRG